MIEVDAHGVDIGFGRVVNYLLNSSVPLNKLMLLRAADVAAERKYTALLRVFAWSGMSSYQRTIDAMAILHLEVTIRPILVAVVAHVLLAEG